MTSTYLSYKLYAGNLSQTLQRTATSPLVSRETQYYEKNIGSVKSVSDFVNNYQLFSYAMQAYGLQDMTSAKAFMTKVLESNVSDSTSFVNSLTDPRYKAFAEAFSFTSTGASADSTATQTSAQESDTLGLYEKNTTQSSADVASAEKYYKANIGSVTSVQGLMNDSQLMSVVLTAYGIDQSTTDTQTLEAALESDVSDPTSAANQSGSSALQGLAKNFNFAADGTATDPRAAQTQTDFETMSSAYKAQTGTDAASQTAATAETTYVGGVIASATSLNDIVSDPRVVAYIGKAFGVPDLSASTLSQVLTSNVSDLSSKANTLGEDYRQIDAAFNFTSSGTIARAPAVQAQSKQNISDTVDNYLNLQIQTEAGTQSPGAALALYFQEKAPSITSVYQILADKSLLSVVQTALNIPATSSESDIDVQANEITSRLKLSDLKDPTKLEKFLSQFSALYDINNASTTTDPSSVLNLFTSSSTSSSESILSLFEKTPASGSILSLFAPTTTTDTSSVTALFG